MKSEHLKFIEVKIMINQHHHSRKKIHHDTSNTISKACAIISLTGKPALLPMLRSTSSEFFHVPENTFDGILDNHVLVSHTVPVCIPLMLTPEELNQFINENCARLLNMLLTAWPFPIDAWYIDDINRDVFKELVEVKYYPIICKAIATQVESTRDLAVTFATPTNELINYLAEHIALKKIEVSEDELTLLDLLTASGVAIITNKIEQLPNQNNMDFVTMVCDSKNYLTELKNNILITLFYFYFKNKKDMPAERNNIFLDKWFDTKTFTGLYLLLCSCLH